MRVDLEALRTLDVVVTEGGFAKAAERLHKAQSAISYQIRKLETALNLELLDRSSYRAVLTPAGEAVLKEGRRLLIQARQVEALADSFGQGWEPRLLVVVDGILPLEPILQALKRMADAEVPTRIQVIVEFLHGVQYRFEKERADLMLVKDYAPHPYLIAEEFPQIECLLVVARGHPLAFARDVTLEALQQHVELSVQDSSDRGDDRHMFGGDRVFYLSGFIAKKQALEMGLGFGWMPRFLIDRELQAGELVEVDYVGGSRYAFAPQLVHRQDQPLGRAGRLLVEALRERVMDPRLPWSG